MTGVFGEEEDPFADPTGFETEDMGEAIGRAWTSGAPPAGRSRSNGGGVGWGTGTASILVLALAQPGRGLRPAARCCRRHVAVRSDGEVVGATGAAPTTCSAGVLSTTTPSASSATRCTAGTPNFSFQADGQPATGAFVFEVALSDNRDLHFDYEQRTGGEQGRQRQRGGLR